MFVETVDRLVLEFQQRLGTNTAIPWGWLFTNLLTLLSRYPTGVTKAILLAELESSWKKIEKFHSKGSLQGANSLRSIFVTKQLSPQAVFEVYLKEVAFVEGTSTRIGVIGEESESYDSCLTMEMYLHQKLYDEVDEIIAHNYKLRFTGCRLFEGRSKNSVKLLPSESFVILIDQDSTERLCESFLTLEGLDKYTESQYIDSIKVKVIEIGKLESIHYPNGQTVNKISVFIVDDLGIQAKFILWEDYLVMAKLFEEGDLLFIKDCFLVPDQYECYTLEYGPETVILCNPVAHGQELVPSQGDNSRLLCVSKDSKGKLDYSMYPERLRICDVKPEMTNLTLFGQVVHVGPKKLLNRDGISKVEYHVKVQDESGVSAVLITNRLKGGNVIYCGQFVLMKNVYVSSGSGIGFALRLNSEKDGTFWNVSALEGWLTTSTICSVTSLKSLDPDCHHCVIKGMITDLKAENGRDLTVRVHCSCSNALVEDMDNQPSCGKCNSSGMVEMSVKSAPKLFNLERFWCWQYSLCLTIMECDGLIFQVNTTNEVAEKLLQLSARQLRTLEADGQRRVFECTFGQECYFGMSNFNGEFLVGVISQV